MELTDLRYFCHVSDCLSFKEAARRSHISSPAMSKSIAKLEDELGAKLFVRTTRKVRLTTAGELLHARGRRILAEVDLARQEIERDSSVVQGELRIGALEVFSIYVLPMALSTLARDFPAIVPKSYEMIPDRIAHRVANGELDVGLSMGLAKLSPQLEQVPLGSSPSLLVCGRGHPLFARARVSAKSLLEHRSVIPEFLGQEHLPVLDQFPDERHPRKVAATIELLQMGIQMAVNGSHMGCFPEITIRAQLASDSLRVLKGLKPWEPFELYALLRAGAPHKPSIGVLIDAVRTRMKQQHRVEPFLDELG